MVIGNNNAELFRSFDLLKGSVSEEDLKSNLLTFKNTLKENYTPEFLSDDKAAGVRDFLLELLNNSDPKIRKNSVICLGILKDDSALEPIYEAYLREETLYNKAAYLEAIGILYYSDYKNKLFNRKSELIAADIPSDERKHLIEEMHVLCTMLREDLVHAFTGWDKTSELVLLTNRNFKSVTMNALKGIPHKDFTAGVMVKTNRLKDVMKIRTFSEALFIHDTLKSCSSNAETAAEEITAAGIVDYIRKRTDIGEAPIFFRVDFRTKDNHKKGIFEKKLASALEAASNWQLINSTGKYEIEFRLIETSVPEKLNFLIRFCTMPDYRFGYRHNSIATGLKPYIAALIVELAGEYMSENDVVVDPFCGSGTLIAEREKYMPAKMYYGIDIYGEAVSAAEDNLRHAGIIDKCNIIKRDFLEFRHDHKFDLVLTDMPFETEKKDSSNIENLYKRFFKHIQPMLTYDSKIVVYTHNRDFSRKYATDCGFGLLREYEISKMEKAYLHVYGRK